MGRRQFVAIAFLTSLVIAAPGFARPDTTNAPAFLTIKVTITDSSVTVKPNAAPRGSNAIFILTNRGKTTQRWLLGNETRGSGKKSGFATVLAPDQQKNVVMYLDYRGQLPYSTTKVGGKTEVHGNFKIR